MRVFIARIIPGHVRAGKKTAPLIEERPQTAPELLVMNNSASAEVNEAVAICAPANDDTWSIPMNTLFSKTIRMILGAAAVALIAAPATLALSPAASESAPAAEDAARFVVKVAKASVKVGATGEAKLTIVPAKGFKWNKDYPAKVTLTAPAGVTLPKTKYAQLKGDFKASEKLASVAVSVQGASAGDATIEGKVKFSVCNATSCVIEEAAVRIPVTVTP